jgi:hypothetical protein
MANVFDTETAVDPVFESERAALLKRAADKPTLRMINAAEARPIEDWKNLYSGLALFIEVTKEDFSNVYEGRLIATAESSVEFLDLDKEYEQRGAVNLTTYGKPHNEEPMVLPPVFWLAGVGLD